MKERPILFSGPMVRAILAGRKTVTRRIVRGGPDFHGRARLLGVDGAVATFGDELPDDPVPLRVRSPYGEPGDRLWVRETWAPFERERGQCAVAYFASCEDGSFDYVTSEGVIERLAIKRWKPSIHMPRWASRLELEVLDVRVERLHDIDEEDARREGVEHCALHGERPCDAYRARFTSLWDTINGDRAPWSSNPWVWRVEFRRLEHDRAANERRTPAPATMGGTP